MSEPEYRIGTADREAALKALEEHLVAGRLDVDEYGERAAKVSVARTADELRPLFADLPPPHALPPVGSRPMPSMSDESSRPVRHRHGDPLFGRLGETLCGLSPFLALGLFFLLHTPWVFLLVPVLGVLIYGSYGEAKRARRGRGESR